MLQGLAGRLGAQHRGFEMTAMEIIDATLKASGWPDAATVLRQRWVEAYDEKSDKQFADGFLTKDKKFHFAPDWAALGPLHACMPKLPDHMDTIDVASAAHPFRLMTSPARSFLNTSFTEMPSSRKREGRPTVMMHPTDADALGIVEGARVRLGNARGEVVLHARVVGGMQPGVLVAESVWPSECFEGGIGINALTSDDPGPPAGGAVFHDTAVWMRAVEAELAIAAE